MAPPGKTRNAAPDKKRTKKRPLDANGAGKVPRMDASATAEQILRSKKSANLVFDLLELLEVRPSLGNRDLVATSYPLGGGSAQVRVRIALRGLDLPVPLQSKRDKLCRITWLADAIVRLSRLTLQCKTQNRIFFESPAGGFNGSQSHEKVVAPSQLVK